MLVNSGRADILSVLTGQLAVDTYDMGLFDNNHTLVEADTLGSLTEVAVSGYFRQALVGWVPPTGPIAGIWTVQALNVTFKNTSGAPVTVYGWFYIGVSRAVFYGGGNFAIPLILPSGGELIFEPNITDSTL